MKKLTKILCAALVLALVFALAACSAGGDKKLTLATSADFPPYEFVGDDGKYAGIDIEVAGLIAEELGMELVVENMEFDSVITSVASGKCSMGMSGITVTEERKQSVDFSDSYATGVQVVIVPEGSPITSVDDLYAEGAAYKVGVQLSTTGDLYFGWDIDDGLTTCSIERYTIAADAVNALMAGKIDCVIIDNEPAKSFVAANEGLAILDTEYAVEDYAICFPKNSELTEKVNEVLAELIANGKVKEVVDKYIPAE